LTPSRHLAKQHKACSAGVTPGRAIKGNAKIITEISQAAVAVDMAVTPVGGVAVDARHFNSAPTEGIHLIDGELVPKTAKLPLTTSHHPPPTIRRTRTKTAGEFAPPSL
jgi:hypothetical protein